jgi:membrane associated rhomboid family serine protease
MSIPLFALLILAGAALYFMTPTERRRLADAALDRSKRGIRALRDGPGSADPFQELLQTRTPRPIVMPVLVGLSACIWIGILFGKGAFSDTQTLVSWGANYTPRTTLGEWWRLATYMFVPAGFFQLVATIAALLPLGLVLERLVGRAAFAAVYVAAGIVAGVVSLWTVSTTTVTAGASGAILGLYGLLAAVFVYGYLRQPRLPVSTLAMRQLAAGSGIFAIVLLFSDHSGAASGFAGLATGLVAGLVLARSITTEKPSLRRSLLVTAAAIPVVVVAALPLRGTIDARPELARIVEMESATASEYAKAVDAFTHGRMSAKALAQVIQRKILPAVEADRARIDALRGVPHEQAPLVAAARQYFELRETSWRRRVEGLTGSSMKMLREADQAERTALEALEKLQHVTAG